jgi:hypothetical protein
MIGKSDDLSLSLQAVVLVISRGSVYNLPHGTSEVDLAMMRRIDALPLDYPFAGCRMLHKNRNSRSERVPGQNLVATSLVMAPSYLEVGASGKPGAVHSPSREGEGCATRTSSARPRWRACRDPLVRALGASRS